MDTAKALNTFNTALKEIRDTSSESVTEIANQAADTAKQASIEVDRAARRHPWYFVGAAAVLAGVAGFVAGRKSKN